MTINNPSDIFRQEAEELLSQIEEVALDLNPQEPAGDAVNQLFRAFHTIKGSGSMFGFDDVASFTHHVETAMDHVREGELALSAELIDLVLAAKDHLKMLLSSQPGDQATQRAGDAITAKLRSLCQEKTEAQTDFSLPHPGVAATPGDSPWHIRFRPHPETLSRGGNPLLLLDELRALGECSVTADASSVPALEELQTDLCYFAWDIELSASVDRNAIEDVFIFADDSRELVIERASKPITDQVPEVVIEVTPEPVHMPVSTPTAIEDPAQKQSTARKQATSQESTVRVPSSKLDHLVNLVGELVMNQSRLTQAASKMDATAIAVPVEEIERLVAELRDCVLGIRMMPIAATFSRFKRLVHDLSTELGKEIDLVTSGEETEMDKTVLDRLADPLVHLIRNSLDHGIEPAAERVKAGKSPRGTLRLAAVHTGSNVVIGIHDDGRGLNASKIRAKAIEKGLIPRDANLAEKDVLNLIFLPGFSTAAQVTNVSGRGVGMDAVKRQIEALRGSVTITTEPGKGTSIWLTLPLTLAIIDGLLVEIGGDQFIVPMSVVMENVELTRADRFRHNERNIVAVRGELAPYIRLRELFDVRGESPEIEKVVLVRHEEDRLGLVVDRVLGSHQTVIQSLGMFYRNIDLVSGATIMGDGRVALILDVAGLLKRSTMPTADMSSRQLQAA